MAVCIVSLIILVVPPAITSQSSWTSPDINIVEEWSLNVLDRIDPAYTHLGTVYEVETEDGSSWHTILVDKNYVLHFDGETLVDSIPYSGDIWRMTFSPDCRYLLGYCYNDKKLLLFDLDESTVKSIPLFSSEMGLQGFPRICVTNDGTVLVKQATFLRVYNSDFNCIRSLDDFTWGGEFVGLSYAGDRYYTATYDSLKAYDMQWNILWKRELFENVDSFHIFNDGINLAAINNHTIKIINTINGDEYSSITLDERITSYCINESEMIFALGFYTESSTGLSIISNFNNMLEFNRQFRISNSRSVASMPVITDVQSISDSGYILCIFPYEYPRIFAQLAIISPDMEIVWLSDGISQGSLRFIDVYGNFRRDSASFWYFDGSNIHSCLIEGM